MGRDVPTIDAPPPGPRRKSETTTPAPAPTVDKGTGEITSGAPAPTPAATPPAAPAAAPRASAAPAPAPAPASGGISGGQVAYLRNKLRAAGVDESTICDRFQVTGIELLNALQFDELKAELLALV